VNRRIDINLLKAGFLHTETPTPPEFHSGVNQKVRHSSLEEEHLQWEQSHAYKNDVQGGMPAYLIPKMPPGAWRLHVCME